jgi:hypothetical protein
MFSGNIDSTNVDIRLALSGTTTLLIIALLVFMVHRLRQRRLLIIMRRKAFAVFLWSLFGSCFGKTQGMENVLKILDLCR